MVDVFTVNGDNNLMENSSRFITIEGAEGVGKSTCIAVVESWLEGQGLSYVSTREPGGTPLGEKLRALLLDPASGTIDPLAELMMMFASRAQHVSEVIKPALALGQWVVCDRFTDSTYAYQGGGRGLSMDVIRQIEQVALQGFTPDLTLVLDLPLDDGLERVANRGERDRFEREQRVFFERVRHAFMQRAAGGDHYRVIDASGTEKVVGSRVRRTLKEFLGSFD